MPKVVVVTGASAGVGRATPTEAHAATIEALTPFTGRPFHPIAESRAVGAGDGG